MASLEKLGVTIPISSRDDFLQIVRNGKFKDLSPKDIEAIIPWGIDKYTVKDLRTYFDDFVKMFGKGWRIFNRNFSSLDVACGASDSEGFWPWLPAILSNVGATCVGVDIGSQPESLRGIYTHIPFDLTHLGSNGLADIPSLGGEKFDLITFLNTITNFVPSDVMTRIARDRGRLLSEVQDSVFSNIETLLKPNGIVYADTLQGWQLAFRNTKNGLKRIK